jgi:hypothetical protein
VYSWAYSNPEDRGSTFFRNFGEFLPHYIALHSRRWYSTVNFSYHILRFQIIFCSAVHAKKGRPNDTCPTHFVCIERRHGTRGSVIGWGTMLQAGRSRIRFLTKSPDFSVDLILPSALCPWGILNMQQEWVLGIFLEVKGGRHLRLTTSSPFVSRLCRKCVIFDVSLPCGPPRPVTGMALPFFKDGMKWTHNRECRV